MSRPVDWWVLDLEGDPTPGSPSAIRRMARSWSGLADDAEYAETRIRQLMGDEALGSWIGEAGDAFRSKTGDLPEQLGKCKDSYRQASEALGWWADRLEVHQGDADAALVKGRAARDDLEAARSRASAAAAAVTGAANAGVLRNPDLEPTPEQVRDARARLSSARAASSSADAAVAAAQARLDQARALALDARSLRESDGRSTASRIHEASDAGIPERSRWDKFKEWAGEAWDVVVTIAKVVVVVLGIVALIIGGPLAWVVFAAALVLLAEAIMKYMDGEGSLWDVAWAALGAIPGTKGLTTLAALRNAFRNGGLLNAGAHVLVSAQAALTSMAAAVRTGAGRIRTTVIALTSAAAQRIDAGPALLRGLRAMSDPAAFGLLGTLRRVPEVMRIPLPDVGTYVYRVFGSARSADGLPMFNPETGFPRGSRPGGASWTPVDPDLADDFRSLAGLPDENPGSYFVEATLVDPAAVKEIRLALPLDGNPGGWPEYILWNSQVVEGGGSVQPTRVGGVNESWTTSPGEWRPPDWN